ncbi:MAG: transposase [Acidimicrobiia bacterium]|nr:transposase [Acidimicrobiia bacterium]
MSKAHDIVRNGLSLAGFFRRFGNDAAAEAWFVEHRWPDGSVCPHCASAEGTVVASRRPMPFRCRTCRKHMARPASRDDRERLVVPRNSNFPLNAG